MKLERHQTITHFVALDLLARNEYALGTLSQAQLGHTEAARVIRETRDALASHVRSGLVRKPRRRGRA
jgi:hypothetical protein